MASASELKTVWQIRYRDRKGNPTETTDSLPKEEYARTEAEREADWREQMYRRGQYDPWAQEAPGEAARLGDAPTLPALADTYVEAKREAGRRGETGGWSDKTYNSDAPILRRFADEVGPNMLVAPYNRSH